MGYDVGLGFICVKSVSTRPIQKSFGVFCELYLSLATGHRHVDETSGVLKSLLRAALGRLLLLLFLNL